jgi:hypothetical protein
VDEGRGLRIPDKCVQAAIATSGSRADCVAVLQLLVGVVCTVGITTLREREDLTYCLLYVSWRLLSGG